MATDLHPALIIIRELTALLQTEKVTSQFWKDKYEKAHRVNQVSKHLVYPWTISPRRKEERA